MTLLSSFYRCIESIVAGVRMGDALQALRVESTKYVPHSHAVMQLCCGVIIMLVNGFCLFLYPFSFISMHNLLCIHMYICVYKYLFIQRTRTHTHTHTISIFSPIFTLLFPPTTHRLVRHSVRPQRPEFDRGNKGGRGQGPNRPRGPPGPGGRGRGSGSDAPGAGVGAGAGAAVGAVGATAGTGTGTGEGRKPFHLTPRIVTGAVGGAIKKSARKKVVVDPVIV